MKLLIADLKKGNPSLKIKGSAESLPELAEIGVLGQVVLRATATPVGENFWLTGVISGQIKQECPKCAGELTCDFNVELKLLIEFAPIKVLEWEGDEDLNFDEYAVKVGLNTQEIPLTNLLREQILLNCHVRDPGATLVVPKCPHCLPIHDEKIRNKAETKIDPRWEKLKDLL